MIGSQPGYLKRTRGVLFPPLLALLGLATLAGCSSATALRCGTDGQSSFVEIYAIPTGFAQHTRAYAQLCAFPFVAKEPVL